MNADLLSVWAPPTIEQLVAERTMNGAAYGWNTSVPRSPSRSSSASDYVADCFPLSSYVADALYFVGKTIAEWVPADLPRRVIAASVDAVPENLFTSSQPTLTPITPVQDAWHSATAQLQLIGPEDRLAMRPAPPRNDSWCVPQTLFDQIARLADHTYTAEWASHVNNQLHALTERDELVGDDVTSILADLSDAAEDASRMADNMDDPR
ncbi:MAG TPA: hypothetical protein VGL13_16440, partial [Polyangiaceae bacterium]